MVIGKMARLGLCLGGITVASGCAYFTPMAETTSPDGRTIRAPASTVAQMEYNWSREKQLDKLDSISERLLARPDSDGNVSAQGEEGHNWKQAMVARDMKEILQDGTNPYDLEIVRTRERHQTGRAALLGLGVPFAQAGANKLIYGDGGAVASGGTYIKQNNTVEGSTMSNSGNLRGGDGGPGGEAPGGDGAPAEGGSRSISIGGVGNMSNSQDAYNGFQNRWDEILHGEGAIGKQPCVDSQCETHDDDEGSAKLF